MDDQHAVELKPRKRNVSAISIIALVLAIIALAVVGFLAVQSRDDDTTNNSSNNSSNNNGTNNNNDGTNNTAVTNFEECAAAGYPVAESYPRQCRTPDGKNFVEEVKGPFSFTSEKGVTVQLDEINNNQAVKSPLTVKGKVPGSWSFEAVFPVVVVDWDGKIIANGQAQLDGDWMTDELVPFTVTLKFEKPTVKNNGALILQKDNPSDLPANDDAVEIPIVFE